MKHWAATRTAIVNDDPKNIEELARLLCEARWGDGTWLGSGVNRSYWRRQARQAIAKLQQEFKEREIVWRLCNDPCRY